MGEFNYGNTCSRKVKSNVGTEKFQERHGRQHDRKKAEQHRVRYRLTECLS